MRYLPALIVVGILAFALSLEARAATIDISEVGGYDLLVGSTTLANSSAENEETWAEGVLGFDIDYTQLDGTSGGNNWLGVTGTGAVAGDYAFDLTPHNADYYVVKVGRGNKDPGDTHYLFNNEVEMNWAFLNINTSFGEDVTIKNIGKVSHVGVSVVPLPPAVWLFGAGLLGLVSVARRKA